MKGAWMKKIMLVSKILILVASCFWFLRCQVKLDEKNVSAKAREIHSRMLTLDTHCDTASNLLRKGWDIGERHSLNPGQRERGRVDLPRMVEGGLDAEFFAVFVGQGERTPEGYAKAKEQGLMVLNAIHKMCEKYPQLVGLATSPEDAYRLKKEGKRIAFIGMENGYPIDKDLSLLKFYYDQGVRYLTLCHTRDNDICDSSTDSEHPEDNGLSDFGRQVVLECNRLGMMVDVSHSSDKSFYNVLKVTKAPVIASHSCCRAVCDSPRNLTDDMLKALAANGGVIQICFLSSYVKKPKPNPDRDKAFKEFEQKYGAWRGIKDEALREKIWEEYEALHDKFPGDRATLKDLVDHIDHVVKVVGVDYVGIGTDFDGGGGVVGCEDASQMYHVTEELLRRGYSEKDIEKVWGGNAMRVFRKVREIAEPVPSEAKESHSSQ
jgi:membrane dipeptidase